MKDITKSEDVLSRLKAEGKSRVLDQPSDLDRMERTYEALSEHRRDFKRKQQRSLEDASKVVLNS